MVTVSGAYGRDYKNQSAAVADWREGKDFLVRSGIYSGAYVNRSDAEKYGVTEIGIRYAADTRIVIVRLSLDGNWR